MLLNGPNQTETPRYAETQTSASRLASKVSDHDRNKGTGLAIKMDKQQPYTEGISFTPTSHISTIQPTAMSIPAIPTMPKM